MVRLKSKSEIELIGQAGKIVSKVIELLNKNIRPGVTTEELDLIAEDSISKFGGISAFKGYRGFPGNICTSINEEVVHGIPSSHQLKSGDIISLDAGVKLDGFFADAAITLPVDKINPQIEKLLQVTKSALYLGIKQARLGNRVSDISFAIQRFVESNGFSVVREFVGHGIGYQMHEEPQVPNFTTTPHSGPRLKEGMILAIEPMVNMGNYAVEILDNGWTAVTKDKMPSAHFEHTVAITENGPIILTKI
jgi:methionyl aminopeptidase